MLQLQQHHLLEIHALHSEQELGLLPQSWTKIQSLCHVATAYAHENYNIQTNKMEYSIMYNSLTCLSTATEQAQYH